MSDTRLVLVRHGESNATVSRSVGGPRTCTGLSPLGRIQAERLRDRWLRHPEVNVDVLMSSAFPRARETAQVIAPALGSMSVVRASVRMSTVSPGLYSALSSTMLCGSARPAASQRDGT